MPDRPLLLKLAAAIGGCAVLLCATVVAVAKPLSWMGDAGEGEVVELALGNLEQRSYVYAADGSTLSILRDEFNRQPIELKDIPDRVIDAILAVEDAGFWTHDGINARGLLRALGANLGAGGVTQGGSTITQQLVKLEFVGPERTIERKAQELVLARRLEQDMTKEEILTRYLNKVWFGNHAYGIQAAAETYFGVSPKDLDMGQAALLAGLIRNPNTNNPFRFPEDAKNRRLDALRRMEDAGVITHDELILYDATPLPTEPQRVAPLTEDYFTAAVREELMNAEWLGATREEREAAINRGGMKIYTTFDPRAQQLALQARNNNTPGVNGVFEVTDPETGQPLKATADVVTIEHATGAVRAMVGGPGFDQYEFNLVTQSARNTGSAAKTFVLASLMEQGYSPNDIIDGSSPCTFDVPEQNEPYTVDGRATPRRIVGTISEMTTRSINCAYVRLGLIARPAWGDLASRLGLDYQEGGETRKFQSLASAPLGANSVTPLQMVAAYGAIANDGVYNKPYMIERVEAVNGQILYQHTPAPTPVLSPQAARLTTQVLKQNVLSGTGTNARIGRPAAGKTGTATNNADVWFVGYTGQYTTSVHIGALGKNVPLRVPGQGQFFGGNYPAKIWGALMGPLHEGLPVVDFPAPGPTRPPTFLRVPGNMDLTGMTQEPPDPAQPPGPGDRPPGDGDDDGNGNGNGGGNGGRGGGNGGGGGGDDEPPDEPTDPEPPDDRPFPLPTFPPTPTTAPPPTGTDTANRLTATIPPVRRTTTTWYWRRRGR
ncbi:MAG TPA: transglycosylase domain-containing protein [Acidimicrobiales bacterium]